MSALTSATANVQPAASSASAGTASGTSTSQLNSLNAQSFLQLLTAQLQHQDPTNPVNEQQMAAEFAQFSTATGINTLNGTVSKMAGNQNASAIAKASALIGKQVATSGNALVTDSGGVAAGAFNLPSAANGVKVSVMNASGKIVDTMNLGSLSAGPHKFSWTNGSPNQAYTYAVAGQSVSGANVTGTTSSLYTVAGVDASGGNLQLELADNPNPLSLSDVQQVY